MAIKAVIGLGNPGSRFDGTHHNIGFAVLDALAEKYSGNWRTKDAMELAEISVSGQPILLIKPQTFMNNSGSIISTLTKKGIKPEEMLVVHDELELPFGVLKIKEGGGHKGHNGIRSIIDAGARECKRLRFGIGRPEHKEDVHEYVLTRFTQPKEMVQEKINEAVVMIEDAVQKG